MVPPAYRPASANGAMQPRLSGGGQRVSAGPRTGAFRQPTTTAQPFRAAPAPQQNPARSTAFSAIQRYHILAGAKILPNMPAARPWGGYPYAVINGAQFPAQEPGALGAGNEFLTLAGGNVANVVNHAGGYSLRVSDDNNMAIEDTNLAQRQPKEFYATQAVITSANQELARVNSSFRLQPGGQTVSILTGWWSTKQLLTVTPLYNGGNPDLAPQNCNEMAAVVLGVAAGGFTGAAGTDAWNAAWRIGGVSEQATQRIMQNQAYTNEDIENFQATRYVNNRDARAVRRLGANEQARPGVGDAYMIATIGHGTPQPGGQTRVHDVAHNVDRDLNWTYHFAGVVAKSGTDRVTLENFARGDNRMAGADPRWYFQMYGEGNNQSFHEFFSATPDYANPVTISVTNPNRPPWWQFW